MNTIEQIRTHFKGAIDCTLREGVQFAGRAQQKVSGEIEFFPAEFTIGQSVRILEYVHTLGIEWAELPNPLARGMHDYNRALTSLRERPKLTAHIRNNIRDLAAAIDCGVEGVSILTTVDEERITTMGETPDGYMRRLVDLITTAQQAEKVVRVSVEHSWNVAMQDMMRVYELADRMHVDRVGIADTLGMATREEVIDRVTAVKSNLHHADIEGHFHNDMMEAVPNMVTAIAHGVNWPNASLAGLGERVGITPWSSFFVRLLTMDTSLVSRYRLLYLTESERAVAEMIGIDLPPNLPTAPNAFTNRGGIHVNDIVRGRSDLYVPYDPAIIGNSTDIVVGTAISGRTTPEMRLRFLQQSA